MHSGSNWSKSVQNILYKQCHWKSIFYISFQSQLQLQQNIRFGSPPLIITGKKLEDAGAVSEDDGLPRSPPEISTLHDVLTDSPIKVKLSCHFSDRLFRKDKIHLERGKTFLLARDKIWWYRSVRTRTNYLGGLWTCHCEEYLGSGLKNTPSEYNFLCFYVGQCWGSCDLYH